MHICVYLIHIYIYVYIMGEHKPTSTTRGPTSVLGIGTTGEVGNPPIENPCAVLGALGKRDGNYMF